MPNKEDIWPQRAAFKQAIKDYRKAEGVTLAVVAERMGLELSTLHDYLYKPHLRPGREPLKALSGMTMRPMSDFDDDPGSPVAGVTGEAFSTVSEEERVMMRAMGSDLSKLTPEQRRAAFEAWSAIVRGYQGSK